MKKVNLILFFVLIYAGIITAQPKAEEIMLTADNVKLHFNIYRGSCINILLESGGGDDLTVWDKIAPAVAAKTGATVICYDRAGFGKSDLPDTPHSIELEARWLWKCLEQAGLNKNLILAGHSFGGAMIKMTASLNPAAIKGILFIDPFTTELVDIVGAETIDSFQKPGFYKSIGVSSEEEFARLLADKERMKRLSREQRSSIRFWGKTGTAEKYNAIKKTTVPINIPVKIITSGKQWLPNQLMKAWTKAHENLASLIPGTEFIIAKDSEHYIIFSQPNLVINKLAEIAGLVK